MIDNTLYAEEILELYRHPLNKKRVKDPDVLHHEFNPSCGDDITIALRLNKDGKIKDVGFEGSGCAISQAAVSLVTEHVKGQNCRDVLTLTAADVVAMLGVPISPSRLACALLGWQALRQAIMTYYEKTGN